MSQIRTLARLPLALALLLTMAAPTQAAKGPGYQAGFARSRSAPLPPRQARTPTPPAATTAATTTTGEASSSTT